MIWTHITDLGDAAIMAPAGLGIAAWLVLSRAYHHALIWLVLFGAGAFLVVCSKIAYVGWGIGVPRLDFTGFSGHSMTATSVLAVAGYFVGSRLSRLGALIAPALGYALGILVGVSRIVLGAHSPSEVVAGCALGALVALLAVMSIRANPRIVAAPLGFGLAFLALVIAVHGEKAPSERLITKVALYLSGRDAAYDAATP